MIGCRAKINRKHDWVHMYSEPLLGGYFEVHMCVYCGKPKYVFKNIAVPKDAKLHFPPIPPKFRGIIE